MNEALSHLLKEAKKSLKVSVFAHTLITYETAKMASEKGFPLELSGYEWEPDIANIPTQSILQAWLRVVHNLNIVPVRVCSHFDNNPNHVIYLNGCEWYISSHTKIVEAGYEECLERGLQEALKQIKIVKNS